MKKLFTAVTISMSYLCLSLCLLTSNLALAQGTKVGVVDPMEVLTKSQKGKDLSNRINRMVEVERAAIDKQRKALEDRKQYMARNTATVSPEQLDRLNKEYEKLLKRYQRDAQQIQRGIEEERKKILRSFEKQIRPIIRQIAVERAMDLILTKNNDDDIFYVSDAINITNEVIRRLDAGN